MRHYECECLKYGRKVQITFQTAPLPRRYLKINFTTGDYAKSHVQFREGRMTPIKVIDYIADHDSCETAQANKQKMLRTGFSPILSIFMLLISSAACIPFFSLI